MQKEFLGRGWQFPFGFDAARGGVQMSEYEQNIKECITVILGTKPGERQMLPEFGCRIHELMFAPATRATSTLIQHYVETALAMWEPRITVVQVDSYPDPNGVIRVEVHYVINSTNAEQNVALALGT